VQRITEVFRKKILPLWAIALRLEQTACFQQKHTHSKEEQSDTNPVNFFHKLRFFSEARGSPRCSLRFFLTLIAAKLKKKAYCAVGFFQAA